jgi:hypothetical protein
MYEPSQIDCLLTSIAKNIIPNSGSMKKFATPNSRSATKLASLK